MNAARFDNLSDTQSQCKQQAAYVDIHCHVLPGLDDGPANLADSLALCRALVEDGITTVIATPHQLGRYDGCNRAPEVRQAVTELNHSLEEHSIPLRVLPGGDVRLDERICDLFRTDHILTVADGAAYLMLELPHGVFFDILPLIRELASQGIKVVLSHPERKDRLARDPEWIIPWLREGVILQITAASLLGELGPRVERASWQFLNLDRNAIVASDAHNLDSRPPCMAQAFKAIERYLGPNTARRVCIENPLRILPGPVSGIGGAVEEKGNRR